MSVVTSRPFVNGAMGASTRAFSWCPISRTKIALVYTAVSDNLNRYFVQIVNFVDGVPKYGTPCQVAIQSMKAPIGDVPMMRMVKIANNRLVLALPDRAFPSSSVLSYIYTFSLLQVNVDDTVENLYTSTLVQTCQNSKDLQPQLPCVVSEGNGVAYFGGNSVTSAAANYTYASLSLWVITMVGDKLTVVEGPSPTVTQSSTNRPDFAFHRADRNGHQWFLQGAVYGMVWQLDTVNGAGSVANNALSISIGLARAMLPVRQDKYISLQPGSMEVYGMNRNGGPRDPIISQSRLATIPISIARSFAVEDAVWLNTEGMFMFLGSQGAAYNVYNDIYTGAVVEPIARMSGDINLFIGQFNDASNTLKMADIMPLNLGLSMSKFNQDSMLHVIDDSNVAIIGSFCAIGDTNPEHSIIVVST